MRITRGVHANSSCREHQKQLFFFFQRCWACTVQWAQINDKPKIGEGPETSVSQQPITNTALDNNRSSLVQDGTFITGKLPPKPIHSDMTGDRPAHWPRSGFGQTAQNCLQYIKNDVLRVSYFACLKSTSRGGQILHFPAFVYFFVNYFEKKRRTNYIGKGLGNSCSLS